MTWLRDTIQGERAVLLGALLSAVSGLITGELVWETFAPAVTGAVVRFFVTSRDVKPGW